jgi:hypothetical protein
MSNLRRPWRSFRYSTRKSVLLYLLASGNETHRMNTGGCEHAGFLGCLLCAHSRWVRNSTAAGEASASLSLDICQPEETPRTTYESYVLFLRLGVRHILDSIVRGGVRQLLNFVQPQKVALAPPVCRWAHRMVGHKKLAWWPTALQSTGGRAGASSALDPLDRPLLADEKRQDK